jgi:EAL domain-containing protein (putative c-di-GMP-specific phosphodiesterase class I)
MGTMIDLPPSVEQALFVDEIGIGTARYGEYKLKTVHQPIFRREGPNLVPFAVEARIAPHLDGKPVAPAQFFDGTPESDRPFLEALCRALHMHNYYNIGIDEPQRFGLYFAIDSSRENQTELHRAVASIASAAQELGLPADMLICEILDASSLPAGKLSTLARELRDHGIRVSIAEFRVGEPAVERVTQIEPDVIKIDGAWFRNVQESVEIAQLFPAVVTAFRGFGAKLLVQGIETPAELKAALEAGADYLQGMLLERPAAAGAVFDDRPRSISTLLPGRKVISFGHTHQKG